MTIASKAGAKVDPPARRVSGAAAKGAARATPTQPAGVAGPQKLALPHARDESPEAPRASLVQARVAA